MRDNPIDHVIRKSLSAGVRKNAAEPCDENLMAAYLDSSLSRDETTAFESHVANCPVCQEILAVALKLQSHEDGGAIPAAAASAKKTLFHFSIPIPVIGALLICIVSGVVFFRVQNNTDNRRLKEEPIAELRSEIAKLPSQMNETKVSEPQSSQPGNSSPAASTRATTAVASKRARLGEMPEGKDQAGMSPILQSVRSDRAADTPISPPPAITAQAIPPLPPSAEAMKMSALSESDQVPYEKKKAEAGGVAPTDAVTAADKRESSKGNLTETVVLSSVSPGSAPPVRTDTVPTQKVRDDGPAAAETANAIAPARTQQPFSRPHIYAASNRIATTLYSTESTESSLRFVIKNLGSNLQKAESKKLGDRVFYRHMGYWIDKTCTEHPENQIVEITSGDVAGDKDYKAITKKYPEIRSVLPAVVYWDNKNYLLR